MTSLPQECNIVCMCTVEFPGTNQITALAQSYDYIAYHENVTALQLCIHADQSDLSFAWPVGMYHSARTEDSAKVHQTLFLPQGWGLGMRLPWT